MTGESSVKERLCAGPFEGAHGVSVCKQTPSQRDEDEKESPDTAAGDAPTQKRKKEYKAEHRSVCVCVFVCLGIIGWRFLGRCCCCTVLLILKGTGDWPNCLPLRETSASLHLSCCCCCLTSPSLHFTSLHLTWCSSTALPSTFWQLNSTQRTHTHTPTDNSCIDSINHCKAVHRRAKQIIVSTL